jgi:hypothetical protein
LLVLLLILLLLLVLMLVAGCWFGASDASMLQCLLIAGSNAGAGSADAGTLLRCASVLMLC